MTTTKDEITRYQQKQPRSVSPQQALALQKPRLWCLGMETYIPVSQCINLRERRETGGETTNTGRGVYLNLCVRAEGSRYRSTPLKWARVGAEVERFAQFVSQLVLSAPTEVMPDTAITTATATVCVCVQDECVCMKSVAVWLRAID